MTTHRSGDERAMMVTAASAVAGGGLVLWSLATLARSGARSGVAVLAGIGGAALFAQAALGEPAPRLARALLGLARARAGSAPVEVAEDDGVDVASMDSFPASDPPSTTGATAQVTRHGLVRARGERG